MGTNIENDKFYTLISETSKSTHKNYIGFYKDENNAKKALSELYNELKKPNIYTTDPIVKIDKRYINAPTINAMIVYYKDYKVLYYISERYFSD